MAMDEARLARLRSATLPFDPAAALDTPEAVQAFIEDARAIGGAAELADAIGMAAQALGLLQVARLAHMELGALREALAAPDKQSELLAHVAVALGARSLP